MDYLKQQILLIFCLCVFVQICFGTSSPVCGPRYHSDTYGSLSSPNYPGPYPNNLYCEYIIQPGTNVYLQVNDLAMERCCDHLQIFDEHGNEMNASSIDYLYGNHFRVVFTTDGSQQDRGFNISWSRDYHPNTASGRTPDYRYDTTTRGHHVGPHKYTNCGGHYDANYVVIESPGYPHAYPKDAVCKYRVNSSVEVELVFHDLNLEQVSDTLYITNMKTNELFRITGINYTGNPIIGREFSLQFESDSSLQFPRGYRIVIQPVGRPTPTSTPTYWTPAPMVCGGHYYANEGIIQSPHYPNDYPNNADCWYDIYSDYTADLVVEDYRLERGNDVLSLVDSYGFAERNITGVGGHDFLKQGTHFRLHFTSDGSGGMDGFRIRWAEGLGTAPSRWDTTTWRWDRTTYSREATTWSWHTSTWELHTKLSDRINVGCSARDFSVAVPRDIIQQVFPGVSEYDLTLNDANCRGQVMSDVVVFRSSILGCGMNREETFYEMVYQNYIRAIPKTLTTTPYYSYNTQAAQISRFDASEIKVECRLDKYTTAVGHYHPNSTHEFTARGHGNYSIFMDFYRDYSYNYRITSYPVTVELNDDVFVDLKLDTGDASLKLSVDSCFAAPYHNSFTSHRLITRGCPADPTVSFERAPDEHVHFRFRAFKFLKNQDQVYIYCYVNVCAKGDVSERCHRNCTHRHRRDLPEEGNYEFHIFQGPLAFGREKRAEEETRRDANVFGTVPAVVMGISAVVIVVAAAAMFTMRRHRRLTGRNEDERIL